MQIRSTVALPLLAVLAFSLTSCSRNETPTEPGVQVGTSRTVHVVGQNTSPNDIGLNRFVPYPNLSPPVEVLPGESVEMMRWSSFVNGPILPSFVVYQLGAVGDTHTFNPIWAVEYKVLPASTSQTGDVSVTVRITLDSFGTVAAVSDKPDVIEIVRVTRPVVHTL